MLILICSSDKDVDIFATYTLNKEWDGLAHKPGLTHLNLVHSSGPFMVLYQWIIVV